MKLDAPDFDAMIEKTFYGTEAKRRKLIEQQFREYAEAATVVLEGRTVPHLKGATAKRRQKAMLPLLNRIETEFETSGLLTPCDTYVKFELILADSYENIDSDCDLRIAAALWILDDLRKTGKLHDAYDLLPDTVGNPDAW